MGALEVAASLAGVLLMLVVLADVVLTTLHPDLQGLIAHRVQRASWRAVTAVASGRRRRTVVAAAGPVMMAATFAVWVLAFVLGYALVVWPVVEGEAFDVPGATGSALVQALYVAGVTVTTLGYGDIVPTASWARGMSVLASASGFAVLTGVVTYVIQLTSSLGDRTTFALQLDDDTGSSGDGVGLVVDACAREEPGDLRDRLLDLASSLRLVHNRLHRLPEVGLYYRSADPRADPERAFAAAFDVALAADLVAHDPRAARVAPAAAGLHRACVRLVDDMGPQYFPRAAARRLPQLEPGELDHHRVAAVRERLALEAGVVLPDEADLGDAALLAARSRVFLDELDGLTRWRGTRLHPGEAGGG